MWGTGAAAGAGEAKVADGCGVDPPPLPARWGSLYSLVSFVQEYGVVASCV